MFAWVELRVLSLFISLNLLENLALLLLSEFLAVNTSVLANDSGQPLSIFNFFNRTCLRRSLFL